MNAPFPFLVYPKLRQALGELLTDAVISSRNVVRHGRRSVSGAMAVMFGAIALMLAAGFIEWIYWAMREGTIHSGLGHIQVVPSASLVPATSDPFRFLLADDSPHRKVLETSRHVASVAARLKFTGLISLGDASLSFLGAGFDADNELGGQDALIVESGAPLSSDPGAGVLLGQGLASNLGAKVGDRVVLLVNKRNGVLGGVEVTVRGVFSSQTKAYDDVAVHVPLRLAQEMFDARGAHAWVVYLDDTRHTADTVADLRKQLPNDLQLVPWFEATDFYNKTVRLFSRQVLVMKIIIAIVVILSISNTMMMSLMERINEIATSLALGVRRVRILSRFLVEGLLIGLIGGVFGVVLAYVLAAGISQIGIPMPPPPGMARSFIGKILVTPGLAVDAMLLASSTALIASLYPAWRASRMVVADALRHGR